MVKEKEHMDTLSQQMASLKNDGYNEEFSIGSNVIKSNSGKEYKPEDLTVMETFRFEGESNPADSSELLAIESNDNRKGLLVLTFGPQNEENAELIKQINYKK